MEVFVYKCIWCNFLYMYSCTLHLVVTLMLIIYIPMFQRMRLKLDGFVYLNATLAFAWLMVNSKSIYRNWIDENPLSGDVSACCAWKVTGWIISGGLSQYLVVYWFWRPFWNWGVMSKLWPLKYLSSTQWWRSFRGFSNPLSEVDRWTWIIQVGIKKQDNGKGPVSNSVYT